MPREDYNRFLETVASKDGRYELFKIATFWTRPFKVAFVKKCDKISAKYPYKDSKIVGSTSSLYNYKKERFEKEWFEKTELAMFEGKEFKIPVEYDKILRMIYNDYMQLPPENERVTHHSNNTFWKEESDIK